MNPANGVFQFFQNDEVSYPPIADPDTVTCADAQADIQIADKPIVQQLTGVGHLNVQKTV